MERADSYRESEERFRGAFEAATSGFALVALNGRLRAVNVPMSTMLGYSEAELLGMTYQALTHPDDHAMEEAVRQSILAGASHSHRETRFVHKDGHVVWGLCTESLVRSAHGDPRYFVAQCTDISRQKAAEEKLALHAAELERSNIELQDFASLASHNLQEPLRTVASYAQLLAARYDGTFDETGTRWLRYISGGVERMRRLVDDMLALARVRTTTTALLETDMSRLVTAAWAELKDLDGISDAALTVGALPTVVAAEAQLEMLIRNLLVNAVKYRRASGPLEIRVFAERVAGERGEDAEWQFAVADNGRGIETQFVHRIFEMFFRVHRDDDSEGTGIGLAICKRIVERHGGRIWVDSVPGEGTTVRFTLAGTAPSPG